MKNKRFLNHIIITCGIFIVIANISYAADYYVKNGGNDSSNGLTDATAWATIAKVNDFASRIGFSNGDAINFKRGSTWVNDETLGYTGSSVSWGAIDGLTIRDYGSGAKPKITGQIKQPIKISGGGKLANLTVKNIDVSGTGWCNRSYSGGQIEIKNVRNVTIDGIYCDGHAGTTKWGTLESGLLFDKIIGKLEIKNCTIFNLVSKDGPEGYDDDDRHTVVFWSNEPKREGSVSIHDNLFHHTDADGIQLAAIQVATDIYENIIHHFGENAIDLKNCKNVNIYNNNLYRGDYLPGGGKDGDIDPAIIVFHKFDRSNWAGTTSENTRIHDNYIHDSDYKGITPNNSTNAEIYQNYFKNIRTVLYTNSINGLDFYDNIIDIQVNKSCESKYCSAVRIGNKSWIDNVKIYRNKIYIDNTTHYWGIVWDAVDGQSGNIIENNIIYVANGSPNAIPLGVYDADGRADFPIVENNGCFNPENANRTLWDGKVNYSFPGAIFTNPKFSNPKTGDFSLGPDSPFEDFLPTVGGMNYDGIGVPSNYLPEPKNLRITIN